MTVAVSSSITLARSLGKLPGGASGQESSCQCKRRGFHPWVGKIPWRRAWKPRPGFLLENPMDRGAWWAPVHRVAKSWTQLRRLSTQFSSVQLGRSVVSDSLQPHESQHARPSCPSPTPGDHSDSCPLSE